MENKPKESEDPKNNPTIGDININDSLREQFLELKANFEQKKEDYQKELIEIGKIKEKIEQLAKEIEELEKIEVVQIEENKTKEEKRVIETIEEESKIEEVVEQAINSVEEENEQIIEEKFLEELGKETKGEPIRSNFLKKVGSILYKQFKRKIIKYLVLPASVAITIALSYESPQNYYEMFQNWKERHIEKKDVDDPNITGINNLYNDSTNVVEKSTYDFLGKDTINYKSGYYMTSVFDLSDRTPPRFKLINDRQNYNKIDSAAGITTSLFENFCKFKDFKPKLKGHLEKSDEEIGDIPMIGYNTKTRTIHAGHYKEFNEDWLVSETYEIPLNFKLNEDGTVNLIYPHSTMRMVPLTTNENGAQIPFPIGITRDKTMKKIDPHKANTFGVLEGGKVIMVCGDKQLQVNGSFADMFCVYERLQKEYKGIPIQAYLLDNGSYNLPIWNKDDVLTPKEIKEHLMRHRGGGTALVLINDERISPYEYKNKYKEFEHYTKNFTPDSITGKPAKNEKSVIVLHHTGNYADPSLVIRQFQDSAFENSAHIYIMKDGTRHLFNTDNYVLAHAGKSDFNNRNKVNYFSIGIELEGDTKNAHQFTVAQLESLLECLRPRLEKYNIPFENITTHKIIRDNYMKKHPNDKKAEKKYDLDDQVWKQIQNLIQKKIYERKKLF